MALPPLVQEYFWWMVLAVFLAGTAALWRLKAQRFLIIFLIRTQRGIGLLDRLGSISPAGWKFLADLSVMISFGGLGAAYVATHRKPWPFHLVLGALAAVFLIPLAGLLGSGILFLGVLAATAAAHRIGRRAGHFLLGAGIMFGLVLGVTGAGGITLPAVLMAGITAVVGIPGILISFLFIQAFAIVAQESTTPGISPLLPGLSQAGELGFFFPGLDIFIPLWSGLAAIIILLVSHEFCHGILARVQGIPVRSMGIVTFGIIPIGAFVEPDEKAIEAKRSEEKMRVYTMGSFANLMVAAIATLLLVAVSLQAAALVEPVGVQVVSVQKGFPAEALPPGAIITAVDGTPVLTVEEYTRAAAARRPGDALVLDTGNGTFQLTSVTPPSGPERAYLGFTLQTATELKQGQESQAGMLALLGSLGSTLHIIFFFNLNIAVVNLLPVLPFDGSKMFEELLKSFNIKAQRRKKIANAIIFLVVALLILNALPLGSIAAGALGG
ncbi:MAG: site-2 protease family protein [Candidatus Aenigmarchaeota archaeon]|nr:site-2 protease family protein [Candidatus Aenigmarchaeota archaeon]